MKPPEITHVGIVGSGTMGTKISYFCITNDKEVYLYDISPEALERSVAKIRARLAEEADPGAAEKAMSRLHPCASLAECVADVQLVIENVTENLEIKRRVFAEIDRLAPEHVLISTNSSSLPSSRIADATNRPDKVLNSNFSEPAVEVMGHAQTSEEAIAAVEAFLKSIGMVPLRTKREIMGYAFNRTWRAIKRETLHLVAGGYADFEDLDRAWMLLFGTPWGPFGLMDEIGLDVVRDIEMQYYLDSGEERDKPPAFLDEWIDQGRLGIKSGWGFYTYPDPAYKRPGWLRKEPPWTSDQTIKLE
jgi:3-hydroxybutyryl-CoA dehydrogenase